MVKSLCDAGAFSFYLCDMAGWKFYLNGIEVEEPIGWDGIEFTAIRMESHGIDQPFSTEVRFYGKGAKLIKDLYDRYFINAQIAIRITSEVGYSGSLYQFDGFLNLAIYEEFNVCDTDSWEITVGIIDDDFREKFKARQDIEIDITTPIDLDGNAISPIIYDNIRMHKQDLYLTATASDRVNEFPIPAWSQIYRNNANGWILENFASVIPAYYNNTDFSGLFGSTFDPVATLWTPSNVTFKNNATYQRTINFNMRVKGAFYWTQYDTNLIDPDSADVILSLMVTNGDAANGGSETQRYYLGTSAINTVSDPLVFVQFDFVANQAVTLNPDDRVLIFIQWGGGGNIEVGVTPPDPGITRALGIYIEDVCLSLSEINSGTFASFSDTLRIENFLNRVIYKLTGSNNMLLSDAFSKDLDGCYWNNAITNGLRIRNAPTLNALNLCDPEEPTEDPYALRTSFKKIFEDLDKIFCLGWAFEWTGTDWKIRVEPREYFYQNSISQSFENVGEVRQMAKSDLLVNNVNLGFTDKWKNISVSGVWAIHTDRNYFIANKAMAENSSARLDIRSNIIGEGYAIEFSRRLSFIEFDSGTSDRPNDYELFIIWLNRFELSGEDIEETPFYYFGESGAYSFLPGEVSMPSNYITASSSPLSGLYNIYHTPARIACRWWKVLGMHTYGLIDERLRYQVGQYQTSYSSTINGNEENEPCIQILNGQIAEDSDIYADILNTAYKEYLFKPIGIEFSYPQSLCDFLTLSQDEQYRKVRLTSGSLDIQGFITEAMNQPEDASGGTTKFTLLMSAQTSGVGGAFTDGYSTGFDNGE
jgi:small nuclear ribonucleoprotein (snRNP)-like protein